MSIRYLLIMVFLCVMLPLHVLSQPSWDKLTYRSKTHHKPVLVYLHDPRVKDARKLKRKTWENPELLTWMGGRYLTAILRPGKAPEGYERFLQKFDRHSQPMLLIFHPEGHLMGQIEGFVAPSTLKVILDRHLKRIRDEKPRPALTLALAPELPSASPMLAYRLGKTRGMDRSDTLPSIQTKVMGFEPYALEKLRTDLDPHKDFGLSLGSFRKSRKLAKKIKEVERFWRGKIWVYATHPSGKNPTYHLAIGPFDSPRQAQTFSRGLASYRHLPSDIIQFSQFLF